MWSKTPNQIKNMMYVKIHKSEHQKVIAICNEGLIGKTISEGDKEINISEDFYKGDLLKEEQVLELLKDASNANFTGDEAVACGIKSGLIQEGIVITIGGVKHAQFYSLE